MKKPRTMIIGLDGATFDLIEPLREAGFLPNLSRLMQQGTYGQLQTFPNFNSAAAWSSMVTGYNPGQHGVYDFGDGIPQKGSAWHPTTAADRQKEPFWRLLSTAGQRVGVMNVPISYPADHLNGFMLAGMDTPSLASKGFAQPPEILDELRRQGIDYLIDVPNLGEFRRRNATQLPDAVSHMIESRARTVLHLMKTHPCDVMMAVFVAPDRVQHQFYPQENTPIEHPSWLAVRSVYQQLDAFLGELLKTIDEETSLLIVSDHGFGIVRPATRLLNQLFAEIGLLTFRKHRGLKSRGLANLLAYGRKIVPKSLQRPLALAFPGLLRRAGAEMKYPALDWSQTKVFVDPHGNRVIINLRGRQPQGIVSPDDYESLRDEVQKILHQVTDPLTNRPVLLGAHKREALFHGPYTDKAGDLLMEWNYEVVRDTLQYTDGNQSLVVKPRQELQSPWKGNHRPAGIFIARGSRIKAGEQIADANICDIAPTVLYLQGQPVFSDMDGKVLTAIFTDEQLRRQAVQRCEPTATTTTAAGAGLDADETRAIEERLRDLGYLE